ncbi:20284_t:CDS:2, partial [Racocetra persica]
SSKATTLCKEVALAIGVGEATIAHIVAEFNKTEEIMPSKQSQRASKNFQTEYMDVIHDQILARNKSGTPLSLRTLIIELSELGFTVSKIQLALYLKNLSKARNYQEIVKVGICDESDENEDENLDLYSENEDSDNEN